MKLRKVSLLQKTLIVTLVPFVLFAVVLQLTNFYLARSSFEHVLAQFQTSMETTKQQSVQDFTTMSQQSAQDLLQEITIAAGGSLQPGESAKFMHLAEKQRDLKQLKEFSFYGPEGMLELSSNPDTDKRSVPVDVLQEAKRTRQLVVRGTEESDTSFRFYEPLFADADMIRMKPGFAVGDFYGMLYVESSKDRMQQSIAAQCQHLEGTIAEARRSYEKAMTRMQWLGIGVVAGFLVLAGIVVAQVAARTIVRPVRDAAQTIKDIAERVNAESSQVSNASQSLAEGAAEQAAGLEETSSSLEEMASMTKQNAENAHQANILAAEAKKAAGTGAESMTRMQTAIQEIQKSSDETAKIIKVIDEIAFQTNLLALNAAVEAARAGEAGKGFAVVADEVRNLAMRSAEAAKNTANMIEESVKNAKNGVDIATEVGKVLDEIVQSIGKTTDLVSEIAAASQEQAQGIDQVNTSVTQVDKVTQQNAANAEESAGASEELSSQAESMNNVVGELVALVGGAAVRRDAKRVARITTRLDAKGCARTARGWKSGARPEETGAPELAASDHILHKIAGKPAPERPAHRATPAGR